MSISSSQQKERHSRLRRMCLAAAFIIGLTVVPPSGASPASASTGYWPTLKISCPYGKYAQVTFTVLSPTIYMGAGSSPYAASTDLTPYIFTTSGTKVVNFGATSIWWQIWTSAGDVSESYSTACVPYLMPPID